MTETYPETASERSRWVLERRPPRVLVSHEEAYAALVEEERSATGEIVPVATIFLTNRECPWRCLMCDLWKNTLEMKVPAGAIPLQIRKALQKLAPARQVKLYNSGSFFDRNAIPADDFGAIAQEARPFERVIVESHPALIGAEVLRFRECLIARNMSAELEVAMGLETAHTEVLAKLNKGMTVEMFRRAAGFLAENGIALRVFVLVKPPFMSEAEGLEWAQRSIDFAFDCGASVVSLIPTRLGNGALEALAEAGQFSPPKLSTLEMAAEYGVNLQRDRVFADLWDLERFSVCKRCFSARQRRLERMNHSQRVEAAVTCELCTMSQ